MLKVLSLKGSKIFDPSLQENENFFEKKHLELVNVITLTNDVIVNYALKKASINGKIFSIYPLGEEWRICS